MIHSGTIHITGINPYILIASDVAHRLRPGQKKPIPVVLGIPGVSEGPWRINLMPRGDGRYILYLSEPIRRAANAAVGDTLDFTLAYDSSYANGPAHPMPPYLASALQERPIEQNNWEQLPPSRKKEVLRYLHGLKSESAQQRNLAALLHVLSGAPGRYMARDWQNGR